MVTTITRALALLAVAMIAGGVHAVIREKPIRLSLRQAADMGQLDPGDPVPVDPGDDPTAIDGTEPATGGTTGDNPLDAPVKAGSLTLREAKTLHEQGATFLDARHDHEYEAGHIAGAFWMPSTRLTSGDGMDLVLAFDPLQPVVIYCVGGECDASENTAVVLESAQMGFEIKIMGLGYEDWVNAGLPTEEGAP